MGQPDKPYPSIARAIILVLAALAIQIVLGMILGVVYGANSVEIQPWHYGLLNLVAMGVVYAWGCIEADEPLGAVLPLRGVPVGMFVAMTVSVLGVHILLSEISNVIWSLLPENSFFERVLNELIGSGESVWGALFLLAVVAPITEEPLFRGLILNGFLNRYSARLAITVSAILFALMHLNPIQFLPALALGLLFGWWRARAHSLWPCLWGHALNNGLGLVLVTLGVEIAGYTTTSLPGQIVFQPLWLDLSGAVLTIIGLWWTAALFRKQSPLPVARALNITAHPLPSLAPDLPNQPQ